MISKIKKFLQIDPTRATNMLKANKFRYPQPADLEARVQKIPYIPYEKRDGKRNALPGFEITRKELDKVSFEDGCLNQRYNYNESKYQPKPPSGYYNVKYFE